MQIIRATKTAEQAGAYYVRIQAMARKHRIPLEVEFDEHDTPDTKYIVVVSSTGFGGVGLGSSFLSLQLVSASSASNGYDGMCGNGLAPGHRCSLSQCAK